jgi:GNAT superfamily N-acetyltransferase
MNNSPSFTLRPFAPEDYLHLARLWNYAYPHLKNTSIHFRMQDLSAPEDFICRRWVAESRGEIAGLGGLENLRGEQFHPRKFRLHIIAGPAHEGRGVGRVLLEKVLAELVGWQPLDASAMVCRERERSVKFAQAAGFQGEMEWFYSRLPLETFVVPQHEKLAARWREEGITFQPFEELAAEAGAGERLHEIYCAVRGDVPSSDARMLPAAREFLEYLSRFPREFEGYVVALHRGRFVGLCTLTRKPHNDIEIHNDLLGVLPEYRRQGVSLGTIARAVVWARSHGFSYATAENAATNSAIIPLMETIGFERQSSWQLFRKVC